MCNHFLKFKDGRVESGELSPRTFADYEHVVEVMIKQFGKTRLASNLRPDDFEALRSSSNRDAVLLMLVTSGVAHLPPIKVVTILSGAAGVDLWLFVASAVLARGARFFFLAWLLNRYGAPIRTFIEGRLGWIAAGVAGALVVLYVALRIA